MKNMFEKERASAREFNRNLKYLEDQVFAWGIRKHRLDKVFIKNHGSYMDRFEGFPENYQGMMVSSWMFSRIILDPSLLAAFARNQKELLFPQHNEYLKLWKNNCPVWSLFNITERKDEDVFEIEDQLTGAIMLLQSRGIANLEMDKPIISILLPLEGIWVSYRIIHQYKGAEAYHILDLMRFIDEDLYEAEDFTAFIHKHYSRFFQIDKVMQSPPVVNNNDLLEPNWMEIILPGFEPKKLSADFHIKYSGNIAHMEPKSASPLPFSEIYFNTETEESCFLSFTHKGYLELCRMVSDYELPEKPDFIFSMSLFTVMGKDMDLSLPQYTWGSFFEDEKNETSPEDREMLETINLLLSEAVEMENQGKRFDTSKRGVELGLNQETIDSVEAMLERLRNKMQD